MSRSIDKTLVTRIRNRVFLDVERTGRYTMPLLLVLPALILPHCELTGRHMSHRGADRRTEFQDKIHFASKTYYVTVIDDHIFHTSGIDQGLA